MKGGKPQTTEQKKKAAAKKTAMQKGKTKSPDDPGTKIAWAEAYYLDDGGFGSRVSVDENRHCMGFPFVEIENTLNQLVRLFGARKGSIKKEEILTKVNAAISVFTEMKPKDSVEAMIITQMISVHEMALLSSERALITEQPDEFVGKNINRAAKLCRTYASLVEALNKHRTKGQQKITVQHVNVENGGQAIVGDVNQGGGND
jgi:hypothetical protein